MRIIVISLLSLIITGCATPDRPLPEPEAPERAPAERADPVEPVPVLEVRAEPEPEPETEPVPAPEPPPEAEPEPVTEPDPAASQRPEPAPAEPADVTESSATVAAADMAETVNLAGRVSILRNGREQPFAGLHLNQTVVAWRPSNQASFAPMDEQQIVTRSSRFFPQTMAVTSGTEVRFPNMDSIRHNVFSLTPGHQFDVGLYGEGEGRSHVLNGSGMVELFCNVHPNMAAFVLVLDTPYFVNPDEDGEFVLRGLPAGPGELLIWNYRAEEIFRRVPMNLSVATDLLELQVDITRPAVPQHTNKHGETYGRDRGRP